jgi:hypothetical protein
VLRLQDLVDKLQVKVKSYKRQAEEAVSLTHVWLWNRGLIHFPLDALREKHLILTTGLFGFRMSKPMFISPNSEKLSMSWRRLRNELILQNRKLIS